MSKDVELPPIVKALIKVSDLNIELEAAKSQLATLSEQVEELKKRNVVLTNCQEVNIDIANENFARAEKAEAELSVMSKQVEEGNKRLKYAKHFFHSPASF